MLPMYQDEILITWVGIIYDHAVYYNLVRKHVYVKLNMAIILNMEKSLDIVLYTFSFYIV